MLLQFKYQLKKFPIMIKIGYVGFGRFAQHRHSILQKRTDLQFMGFYDSSENLPYDYDIKRFNSVETLLNEIDAVIVSVPPYYAAKFCNMALSKNIHVFCEKPPATKLKDLEILNNHSNKLILAYGFNHRLHDSVIHIKEIIDSKKMGKILWMRGRYGKEVDQSYSKSWRCDKKLNGGGILIDQGIHLLDIMDWLAGGFDFNQAILSDNYLKIDGLEDNAFINLYNSKNEISASLHSTITQWRYLFSLEVFLEKGSIILNGLRTSSGNYGEETLNIRPLNQDNLDDKEIIYSTNNSWKREMDTFFNCINEELPYPYSGLNEAKNIMNLLESIYSNAIWTKS